MVSCDLVSWLVFIFVCYSGPSGQRSPATRFSGPCRLWSLEAFLSQPRVAARFLQESEGRAKGSGNSPRSGGGSADSGSYSGSGGRAEGSGTSPRLGSLSVGLYERSVFSTRATEDNRPSV